jgi:ferredoxin like protein
MTVKTGKGKIEVKDRLSATERRTDSEEHAHIKLKKEICDKCPHHMCVSGCPAGCFTLEEGGKEKGGGRKRLVFKFEDCLECGTCSIVCDQGSVSWSHPRGTYGIRYKYG